jgi:hypothetical protein
MNFIYCFQSEWLKKKKSAASWLTIIGGFFIPLIILIARMVYFDALYADTMSPHMWEHIADKCWQFMAIFLLPMGVILTGSLITQIEFRNNTWKQVHTTPQSMTTIFFAKLSVILVMLLGFFLLFNIGIYLVGTIPSLVFRGIPYPPESFPFSEFIRLNTRFFISCLPIVAFQYLISLQFKNFLVSIGAGLGLLVASIIAVQWKYAYIVPYAYCMIDFMSSREGVAAPPVSIHILAPGYFCLFTLLSYVLYIFKKEKG